MLGVEPVHAGGKTLAAAAKIELGTQAGGHVALLDG
jgi:hypothetical protein